MINYAKQVHKFILAQGKASAARLYRAIERLPSGDVKYLQGTDNPKKFRLRIGDYRVLFHRDGDVFYISKVDNRGDAYKGM